MSKSIKNKSILVTRPEHQADYLCKLIKEAGGIPLVFPSIEIRPILKSGKLSNCFNNINEYDFVIFVSRNAVKVVFENYLSRSDLSGATQLLAIGSGTASVLAEMEMMTILHAGVQADSESLLLLPELQQQYIQDKRILIVRGIGGREVLADGLKAAGGLVEYAEVYQRCLPEYSIQQRQKIWQFKKPDAVIVSSNEGLNNLLELTLAVDRDKLFETPLIVMSKRNEQLAKKSGFVQAIGVANSRNDEGLLSVAIELVGDE